MSNGLQGVLLQVDKFREEAEEEKLYMDWVEEMSEWKDMRSIWNSIGGILGGFLGSMFGNPQLGYIAGSTIVGGADYLMRPDAPEAVELGGKFVTQGEREAERVMEAEQPDFMDFLNQNFANIVNYVKMGGDFKTGFAPGDSAKRWGLGKAKWLGGEGFGDGVSIDRSITPDIVEDTTDMSLTERFQTQIAEFMNQGDMSPMETAVGLGTAYAMLDISHPKFAGKLPGVWTPGEAIDEPTGPAPGGPSEDDSEQLYQEWLAQMGLQSPTYTPTGYGSV